MSYGLRVWNASGVLQLDITHTLTRFISFHSFNLAAGGSIYISTPSVNWGASEGAFALNEVSAARGLRVTTSGYGITVSNPMSGSLSGSISIFKIK